MYIVFWCEMYTPLVHIHVMCQSTYISISVKICVHKMAAWLERRVKCHPTLSTCLWLFNNPAVTRFVLYLCALTLPVQMHLIHLVVWFGGNIPWYYNFINFREFFFLFRGHLKLFQHRLVHKDILIIRRTTKM